ncbi:MAG: hypothetical protein Q4G60_14075 [bacterium]|nr:hypothetical protein [bacterium]
MSEQIRHLCETVQEINEIKNRIIALQQIGQSQEEKEKADTN